MKQSTNKKTAKLTRQALAALLALVLMTSAFVPGLTARAAEGSTDPVVLENEIPALESLEPLKNYETAVALLADLDTIAQALPEDAAEDTVKAVYDAVVAAQADAEALTDEMALTEEQKTEVAAKAAAILTYLTGKHGYTPAEELENTGDAPDAPSCTCPEGTEGHLTECPLYISADSSLEQCTCTPVEGVHVEECALYVAPSAYELAMEDLAALEAEAETLLNGLDENDDDYLYQMVEVCDAYYDRLFAALNVLADLWEADTISDEEYSAAEEIVAEVLQYLLDTYGYEPGMVILVPSKAYKKYFNIKADSGTIRQNDIKANTVPTNFPSDPNRPVYVNEEIPETYADVILGYKEASKIEYHIPEKVKADNGSGGFYHSEGLDRCKDAIVNATAENHDLICNETWVEYREVGKTADGENVHVRVTIVDYEPLSASDTEGKHYIGLQTTATNYTDWTIEEEKEMLKRPGVSVYHINWVTLQYDFFDDNGDPIKVKGNTTYYDVDWNQVVHLHDGYDGIYVTDDCLLYYFDQSLAPTVEPKIGEGIAIFDNNDRRGTDAHAAPNDTKSAFTEVFDCYTMTRTFSFRRGHAKNTSEATAKGGIFNNAEPVVRTGKLIITKTVNGGTKEDGDMFTFDIKLGKYEGTSISGEYPATYKNSAGIETAEKIEFVKGKASVTLADGGSVTIASLPAGITYEVTEQDATAKGYITSSEGAEGEIPLASLGQFAQADFVNSTKTDVTLKKVVTGNLGDWNKEFTFKVEYTEVTDLTDGSATADNVETITLRHGEEETFPNILTGTVFKVSEIGLVEGDYEVSVNGADVSIVDGVATFVIEDVSGDAITIEFENNKNAVIETGVAMDSMPYVLILGVVAMAAFLFLRKRRVED